MDSTVLSQIDRTIASLAADRRLPSTTYRVQFGQDFTFSDAEALVPYLHRLGISDLYASPILRAVPGSTHGYDVCDPGELNPELGTRADFERLSATLKAHGMGLLLDIVPNHMGIAGNCNDWWTDVLENGQASRYAPYFDIDWTPVKPELAGKVLLPVLEDQYGNVLDSGKLAIVYVDGRFELHYGESRLPVAPGTYAAILVPALEGLIARLGAQHDDVLELQSIVTSIGHLPRRDSVEPAAREERHREKEVIKRRVAALYGASLAFQTALEDAIQSLNGLPGDPRSFDPLDALIREQPYRLAFWRVAGEEINYRRFFDVNTMAAIHNELPEVFHATHDLVLELVGAGHVTSLRVDHPDGLWNPPGYFRMLQTQALAARLAGARSEQAGEASGDARELLEARVDAWLDAQPTDVEPPLYVVAEKILSETEPLPRGWAVSGTTGYDFMNQVNGVFVDQRNEQTFNRLYAGFIGADLNFQDLTYNSKRMIMRESLAGEINSLAHQLERLAEANRHYRDFTLNGLLQTIREFIACLGIYRTYITGPDAVSTRDQSFVEAAIREARGRNVWLSQSIFYFLRDCLLLRNYTEFDEPGRERLLHWVMRFQQVTGPVMAKSVEDTVFYVYNRLTSLNEVGGQPTTFGLSPDEFHRQNAQRRRSWPYALTSSSTHDTKRSEDVRARLNVLSELPDEWAEALALWSVQNARHKAQLEDGPAPNANDEYLLYQSLLGAWPLDPADLASAEARETFRQRIQAYMAKATKEGKVRTSWMNPNAEYDEAVSLFIARILDTDESGAFLEAFTAFQQRITFFGKLNSLSQTLLKLVSPGVPDTYRGTESWDFSLVDPDNRRPVDYERLSRQLEALDAAAATNRAALVGELAEQMNDGRVKLYLTRCALAFRTRHAALFSEGDYQPLAATGSRADYVCAFARTAGGETAIVVTPRLVAGLTDGVERLPVGAEVWGDTWLPLPDARAGDRLRNVLTGEDVAVTARAGAVGVSLADVLSRFPVALLAGADLSD